MSWEGHSCETPPATGRFTQGVAGLFPSHQKPASKRVWREVCMEQRCHGFLEAPSSLHWGHNPPLQKWLQKTQVMIERRSHHSNVRIHLSKSDGKKADLSSHTQWGWVQLQDTWEGKWLSVRSLQPHGQPHFCRWITCVTLKHRQGLAWGERISIYSLQMLGSEKVWDQAWRSVWVVLNHPHQSN